MNDLRFRFRRIAKTGERVIVADDAATCVIVAVIYLSPETHLEIENVEAAWKAGLMITCKRIEKTEACANE